MSPSRRLTYMSLTPSTLLLRDVGALTPWADGERVAQRPSSADPWGNERARALSFSFSRSLSLLACTRALSCSLARSLSLSRARALSLSLARAHASSHTPTVSVCVTSHAHSSTLFSTFLGGVQCIQFKGSFLYLATGLRLSVL